MSLEDKLRGWTGPSSPTEQEKQERTERMIRQAVLNHPPFFNASILIYAKGSYANNTNVRLDSDVDIAVECTEVFYWENSNAGIHPEVTPYTGIWTPEKLRTELSTALRAQFPGQVDESGSTALQINSNTSRVDADVVPCFSYRYYLSEGQWRVGTKIFPTGGAAIVNYPIQQLENGRAKNLRTNLNYKKAVRALKRIENAMAEERVFRTLPSYFIECLAYNCPDNVLLSSSWSETVKRMLVHLWEGLQGDEPSEDGARWLEVNDCFYLFHPYQKWTRSDGREFAHAAWNFLGYS